MKTEFLPGLTRRQALKAVPCAAKVIKTDGGYTAFESVADYATWKAQAGAPKSNAARIAKHRAKGKVFSGVLTDARAVEHLAKLAAEQGSVSAAVQNLLLADANKA